MNIVIRPNKNGYQSVISDVIFAIRYDWLFFLMIRAFQEKKKNIETDDPIALPKLTFRECLSLFSVSDPSLPSQSCHPRRVK